MSTSSKTQLLYLKDLLSQACPASVVWKRMFGCDAVFAEGRIFGLVWKEGRIGLKMPDPALYKQLHQLPGAAPWVAGDRTMSHWLLVPPSFHDDTQELAVWVAHAHKQACVLPATPKKK